MIDHAATHFLLTVLVLTENKIRVGAQPKPIFVVEFLLTNVRKWETIDGYFQDMLRIKKAEECLRDRRGCVFSG